MHIDVSNKKTINYKWALFFTLLLIGAIVAVYKVNSSAVPSINAESLQWVTVQQSNLDIMTPVFGHYASRYERLLSAPVNAQVSEIYLRAGANVEKGTIIAKLSNPDLEQQHFEAQSRLEQMQSEFTAFQFQKENEQLAFEAQLADKQSAITSAKLDVDANERLAKNGIVAKIEQERAILKYQQLKKQHQFEQHRYEKQKEMHKLQINQEKIKLNQQQQKVALIAKKVSELTVKAGISGTLQRLDIELGQRVTQGQAMARVGSKTQLMARLNLPQRISERIKLGAKVQLRHPNGPISAQIKQMSSIVESGFITAEVHLTGLLPRNLRPAQPVNAYVFVETVKNALYVEQKPGLQPLGAQSMFKKRANASLLDRTEITFGELSQNKLLITHGVKAGDMLVSTDLSQWQKHAQLQLDSETF